MWFLKNIRVRHPPISGNPVCWKNLPHDIF
jgi:hypothetical protein